MLSSNALSQANYLSISHWLPNGKECRRPLQQLGAEGLRKRQYDQIIAVGQQEEV